MFITIGCAYVSLVKWYTTHRRHKMYHRYLPQVVRNASIMVQKNSFTRSSGALSTMLDLSAASVQGERLFNDKDCIFSKITPKLKVNLDTWTAYYAVKHKMTATDDQDLTILLESHRPSNMEKFIQDTLDAPVNTLVHVLDHGNPIAWKPGPPFGIIMQCSVEDLTALCMAFADRMLTMDEDLLVQRIYSIETEGQASHLVPTCAEENQDVQTEHTSEWSNESLADSISIANLDALGVPEEEEEGDYEDREDQWAAQMTESGCGESLCEVDGSPLRSTQKQDLQHAKPPNVLLYCGTKDATRKFEALKSMLVECLNSDRYVIYHLKHDHVHSTPWADNTELLVISADSLYDKSDESFFQYYENGGKVISFGSTLDSMFVPRQEVRSKKGISVVQYESREGISLLCGCNVYTTGQILKDGVVVNSLATDVTKRALIVQIAHVASDPMSHSDHDDSKGGVAVLSQVLLDQDPTDVAMTPEIFDELKSSNSQRIDILRDILERHLRMDCQKPTVPPLTSCHLLSRQKKLASILHESVMSRLKENMLKSTSVSLLFCLDETSEVPCATSSRLPVIMNPEKLTRQYFNEQIYWENLRTSTLGNVMMYTDVISTTMPLFDGLQFSTPKSIGLIAVAGRQTQGKGRGGNVWLSPEGCAMFSLHVRLAVDSHLGRAASFLQHITSLAVVESVRSLSGYNNIDLRLKWPNDIYYSNKMKLGGVIVKSTIMGSECHAVIGCGFNVSNSNPTVCINDLIRQHNNVHGGHLKECSIEQLIARTVTIIEELIQEFQEKGPSTFCDAYYNRWLHSDSVVQLESEGHRQVTIKGLDEYGYLLVVTEEGKTLSVQPDGNSFDMMANLISIKTS